MMKRLFLAFCFIVIVLPCPAKNAVEKENNYFEAEPFAGTSYEPLEQNLLKIRLRALKSMQFTRNMLAKTAALSNERFELRRGEFLSRLACNNMFVIESSLYIFSQLFETSSFIVCNVVSFILKQFGSSPADVFIAQKTNLSRLKKAFCIQKEAANILFELTKEIDFCLRSAEEKNRFGGEFKNYFALMRKANYERIKTIKNLNNIAQTIINQFIEHEKLREAIMLHIKKSPELPNAVRMQEFSKILFACKDLLQVINSCKINSEQVSFKYDKILENYVTESGNLSGISSSQKARISAFYRFSKRECSDEKEPRIVVLPSLEKMFSLLKSLSELYDVLTDKSHEAKTDKELIFLKETKDFLLEHFKKHLTLDNWPNKVVNMPKITEKSSGIGIENIEKYDEISRDYFEDEILPETADEAD